jgi:hypothetical protein
MLQMTLHLTWSRPPVDISTPRILSVSGPVRKKRATSTVSLEIHKSAIFDHLKIKTLFDIFN